MLSTTESVSIIGVGATLIAAIVGGTVKIYQDIKKVADDNEKGRSRIYERLDEVKDVNKKEFVNKEVCEVVHKTVNEKLEDIKKKTDCIPEIKAGIDSLLKNTVK